MMIDKKPIQDMPNKNFGDKHFASEFNKVKTFLLNAADVINEIPSMIESDFKGVISPSDLAPTLNGTYKPSVSSEDNKETDPNDWGTLYSNAGNLRAKEGYNTIFYLKDEAWTKSEVKIADDQITPDKTISGNSSNLYAFDSGNKTTIGNNNLSFGYGGQTDKLNGDNNVNVGHNSQQKNGSENTTLGNESLKKSGNSNTSIGFASMNIAQGDENTAVGKISIYKAIGNRNTSVGTGSGVDLVNGSSNTLIGAYAAAGSPANMNYVICIGDGSQATKSYQTVIGTAVNTEVKMWGEILVNDRRMYYDALQDHMYGGGAGPTVVTLTPGVYGNTGWGSSALKSVQKEALMNTAFGYNALSSCEKGIDHTAVGAGALQSIKDSVGCTAIGRLSLANCLGTNNTGVGDTSMENLTTGESNTSIGYGTGARLITGDRNTFVGIYAGGWWNGSNDTTANRNFSDTTVVGANALQSNVNTSKNTIVGSYSAHLLTGCENATLGYNSLRTAVIANNNTTLGNYSAESLTSGDNNVFIGYKAGSGPTQNVIVSGSTVIGASTVSTRDNEVVIGKNTDTHVTIAGVEFTRAQILALMTLVS